MVSNTDQGSQFTSLETTQFLQERGVKTSTDDKGWYQDDIFVERLRNTVKYEEVYLKAYASVLGPGRPGETGRLLPVLQWAQVHLALGYRTPPGRSTRIRLL